MNLKSKFDQYLGHILLVAILAMSLNYARVVYVNEFYKPVEAWQIAVLLIPSFVGFAVAGLVASKILSLRAARKEGAAK